MTNQQMLWMVERYHKPSQNVKIKTTYILISIGIIGVACYAIRSSIKKSDQILELKDRESKNLESIEHLASKTAMLENDKKQNESIIETLNAEKKILIDKLKAIYDIKNSQ